MERRKHARRTVVASIKVHDLDDVVLCKALGCDQGKAMAIRNGMMTTEVIDCPECKGRGFKIR